MSFAEKMQIASLVLEYAKVALGYSVTIPLLVAVLCWLFREQVERAIDATGELAWGKASVKLGERTALAAFRVSADETKTATAYATVQALPKAMTLSAAHEKSVDAIASFFGLATRFLPLIPKAERHRFIQEETKTLPEEFAVFRQALLSLAETAPEVHALKAKEVLADPEWFNLGRLSGRTPAIIPPPKV